MATKLGLYNGAAILLKERKLVALTDNTPLRQTLDLVYDDVVAYMLEQGMWNFAQRSVKLEPDPDVDTSFGYKNAFQQPSDMVRICKISANERFYPTLDEYLDEGTYFYADIGEIFLSYVSDGASYGGDLSLWPATFTRAVEFELALRVSPPVTKESAPAMQVLEKRAMTALRDARSKDAMRQPVDRMQPGRLAQARRSRRNGGNGGLWDL